jgi:hypothetical protein
VAVAKRVMDVEDVVRWACAQELPKKRRSPRAMPRLATFVPRAERTTLGPWIRPAGFPEISPMFSRAYASGVVTAGRGGEPHPDALLVERAVLALTPDVLRSAEDEVALCAALAGDIGTPVDAQGALSAALGNAANLALAMGRLGKRPDPGEARFAVVPRLAGNGKPGVFRTERLADQKLGGERDFENPVQATRAGSYPPWSYCVIGYQPDPQLIVNDRADWLAWRLALEALAVALSGALATIAALPPSAPWFPWAGETDGGKPANLFGAAARRVHRGPAARDLEAARRMSARRALPQTRPMRRPAKPAPAPSARRG